MAIIKAPNKSYTGVSASVAFCNGEGKTDNKHLIGWFKEHGYEVIEDTATEGEGAGQKALTDMSGEELTAYAQEKGIDIGQATTQAGILKKIQDAEAAKNE
jgi:hypothetical protein